MGLTLKGLKVHAVDASGQARSQGVQVGWRVSTVNNEPVSDQSKLTECVKAARCEAKSPGKGDKKSGGGIKKLRFSDSSLPPTPGFFRVTFTHRASTRQGPLLRASVRTSDRKNESTGRKIKSAGQATSSVRLSLCKQQCELTYIVQLCDQVHPAPSCNPCFNAN